MLRFEESQLGVLEQEDLLRLEDRIFLHAKQHFAQACASLGDDESRLTIRRLMTKARGYDLTTELDQCRYVDTAFVFGEGFDIDIRLPSAKEVLTDPRYETSLARGDALVAAAKRCLAQMKSAETRGPLDG